MKRPLVQWQTANGIATGKIKQIVTDGQVPYIEVEAIASPTHPLALIEVWRDGLPSGVLVAHPLSAIVAPLDKNQDFLNLSESQTSVPTVTPEQLAKINQVMGSAVGMPAIEAHEVASISFVCADNLLSRSHSKWIKPDLEIMAKIYPGMPFTLDHNWGEVEKTQGKVYDGRVVKGDASDKSLNRAGNLDLNREVVAKEGHWECIVDVAFSANSPLIDAVRFGQVDSVSAGGFNFTDLWCPICDRSFYDAKCPHGIPEPWSNFDQPGIAPYYIRKGLFDLGELSAVLIGNLPNAGVQKS